MGRRHTFLFMTALLLCCSIGLAQNPRSTPAPRDPKLPVLKAKTPVEIVGTVIAYGEWGIASVDASTYLDVVVIRVEKKLAGHIRGHYIRADFMNGGTEDLPKSLFDGTPRKMRLKPGWESNYRECDWTIRPTPPPRSLEMPFGPRMASVGGAKSFPDVNGLDCYVLEPKNIQEINSRTRR